MDNHKKMLRPSKEGWMVKYSNSDIHPTIFNTLAEALTKLEVVQMLKEQREEFTPDQRGAFQYEGVSENFYYIQMGPAFSIQIYTTKKGVKGLINPDFLALHEPHDTNDWLECYTNENAIIND